MNKLRLLATATLAITGLSNAALTADMPVKGPIVPLPPPFTWTGFYIGGNIGAAWAQRNVTDTLTGLNFGRASDGVFTGGGQVGFNYQTGNFVLGLEADFDWIANDNNNSAGVVVPGVGTLHVAGNDRWVSGVAARFGIAADRWLAYGKAGGGWVGASNFAVTNVNTGAVVTFGNGRSNSGFLVGAGIEYAFVNNWTAKIEYDYLGLSNRSFVVPAGAPFLVGDVFSTTNRNVQQLKVGFNYLFGRGPGF